MTIIVLIQDNGTASVHTDNTSKNLQARSTLAIMKAVEADLQLARGEPTQPAPESDEDKVLGALKKLTNGTGYQHRSLSAILGQLMHEGCVMTAVLAIRELNSLISQNKVVSYRVRDTQYYAPVEQPMTRYDEQREFMDELLSDERYTHRKMDTCVPAIQAWQHRRGYAPDTALGIAQWVRENYSTHRGAEAEWVKL